MSSLLDASVNEGLLPQVPQAASSEVPIIPSRHLRRTINGAETDVITQVFADRVFVIVTQLGKIGSLIAVTPPPPTMVPALRGPLPNDLVPSLPRPDPAIEVRSVFGAPPSEHYSALYDLYATQIGAIVFAAQKGQSGVTTPVLLGVALKRDKAADDQSSALTSTERETFKQVMELVMECQN